MHTHLFAYFKKRLHVFNFYEKKFKKLGGPKSQDLRLPSTGEKMWIKAKARSKTTETRTVLVSHPRSGFTFTAIVVMFQRYLWGRAGVLRDHLRVLKVTVLQKRKSFFLKSNTNIPLLKTRLATWGARTPMSCPRMQHQPTVLRPLPSRP